MPNRENTYWEFIQSLWGVERYDAPSRISQAIHPRLVCVIMYINLIVVFYHIAIAQQDICDQNETLHGNKNTQVYNLLTTFSYNGAQYIHSSYMLNCYISKYLMQTVLL